MANVVLMRAYYERPNFYSAAVYISQSTGSLMFLVNLMLIVAAGFGYGLQRLFYGPLRPIETEQLYDKAWFAVSETLLAMTIFRDDIGIWFFTMFLCLLAGKVWQWIGEGRVEFLEQQPPANPRLFHTRLMSSLLLSVGFDIFMMQYCIDSILSDARPGVMVMFGFEYVLLAIASISTLLRYTLALVELFIIHRQEKAREETRRVAREQAAQRAAADGAEAPVEEEDDDEPEVPGWEEKGRWVFYLDLATDFIKSVVYLGFFMILMTFYGIPIHIMRDLFMTIRSFIKRVNDFVQYRNATRDMNTRYPDATAEELERENTCIVCREEMRVWVQPGAEGAQAGRRVDERQRAKKLPCGHILHFSCLRSWLERQQNQQNRQGQNNLLQALLRGNPPHDAFGQQAQPAQQAAPAGQQNQAQPNMRVFNFGPFRIALGNLRVPPEQQGNPEVMRNAMDQLRQQAQNLGQPNQTPAPTQTAALPQAFNLPTGPLPGAIALHPADVQSDILRIQQNIIESLRQLNAQHEQLEVIHNLLGELNRLQRFSGVTAATGQELPHIAPLNSQPPMPFTPQAYFARGPALRQGDTGVPAGLTLPEGWTLRPMALAPRASQDSVPAMIPSQSSQIPAGGSSSSSAPTLPARPPASSSPRPAEPSSLDSSWSFGNTPERNNAEGSSSAVAGNSAGSHGVSRRTVTVEDAVDNGQ
ncbi:hypothetical protein EK21DRAFT_73332 [Setomelanomma holmii]|uniref:E3 ubiquitin-protein ligase synoviolin-like TPR repeats domain-containing protein n=1 Tax=Setomelanomma holmii TaxID=210430 RepID=A0A9P4H2N2_9PLEO|nr:hypothetical protein EK21DRAFT_73332 [Setomelanomma holmii]